MTKDTPDPAHDDDHEAPDSAVDLEQILGGDDDEDAAEDAMDISDLDELGVDGLVNKLRGGPSDPDRDAEDLAAAGLIEGPRKGRSPIASAFVLVAATYLLITMFADFRYWLGDEPLDLGEAADLVASGRLESGELDDAYIVMSGTPDVQNVGRGKRGKWTPRITNPFAREKEIVRYLRITEASGGLFAVVPQQANAKSNAVEGRYQGRLTKLRTDRAFAWLTNYIDALELTVPVDHPNDAWLAALRAAPGAGVELGGQSIAAAAQVRLVTQSSDIRLQLGKSSFTEDAAAQAVAALGYPWIAQEPTGTFYRFIARIPESDRAEALEALQAQDKADGSNPADPRIGVVLFPLRAAFFAEVGALKVSADSIAFPYGENTTPRGFEVSDGKLVETSLSPDGLLTIPLAAVSAIRYERPIRVDPNGYIIQVGADPSSERMMGVLWLVVLGLAVVNMLSIVVWLRRRGQ